MEAIQAVVIVETKFEWSSLVNLTIYSCLRVDDK